MRILLVGEYSRLHNSLKEGLISLGHHVVLLGMSDGFKNYPVDISIERKYTSGILKKTKNAIYKLCGYDLESKNVKKQIIKSKKKASGFDVVQFINEAPFGCVAKVEKEIFDLLRSWNTKSFLLSCGTDYTSVKYAISGKLKYSIFTPYYQQKDYDNSDSYGLKFLQPEFKDLHEHILNHITGIISSDIDYHLPLLGHPKYLGMIPNPINIDKIAYTPIEISDKIVIFHGINSMHYYKKGNDLFEKALDKIKLKYSNKIEVVTTKDVPYDEYILAYDKAHILLDQVYAYDQGYNALEAMAKGKVVFTGAEQPWLEYYKIKEDTIAVNAIPDIESIASKLIWLIEHPEEISKISGNARRFIEDAHDYRKIAETYLNYWASNL